jgi:cell wall-associated NlpC family hydrolase
MTGSPHAAHRCASLAVALLLPAVAAPGCRSAATPRGDRGAALAAIRPCPEDEPAPPILPHALPLHSLLDFWLSRTADTDVVVLDAAGIARQNRQVSALREETWPVGRWELDELRLDGSRLRRRLQARLRQLVQATAKGQRVLVRGEHPQRMIAEIERRVAQVRLVDEVRVVHRSSPLRCFPTDEGVYEKAWQLPFDLNQCAQLRLGEPVRVAARGASHWYVWSTYADGWVKPEALTPPLTAAEASAYLHPARVAVVQADRVALWASTERKGLLGQVRLGARLPLVEETATALKVLMPTRSGLSTGWLPRDGVNEGVPPLTRRAVLQRAFSLLNTPYAWGGTGENRDCSRLMMDLFGAFGLLLPRNTWHQAQAGTMQIDVGQLGEAEKAEAIERAARRGIVLLFMPGHIMLYLGRDGDQLYAFHQFSGYLVPCAGGGETMMRVNRAVVTTLELGRGSSRRSFLQRITRLVVFQASTAR